MSAYERGLKTPNLAVAERIVEAAGYRLDLVTEVNFTQRRSRTAGVFWVPDRLWRGRLPECFAKIYLDDATRFKGLARDDLKIAKVIRQAWQPAVTLAGNGPRLRPWRPPPG